MSTFGFGSSRCKPPYGPCSEKGESIYIEIHSVEETFYRSLPVVMVLGDLCAHVLVPELAQLAHGVVLAGAEEGVAGVLSQVVPCQLVCLQARTEEFSF